MFKFRTDYLIIAGYVIMALLCISPIFLHLPFRPNIYLSWEGSYRIANGEIPFRDFGMPFGVGFWILPVLFFKMLGPAFKTLVVVQAVVNLLSLAVIYGILKEIKLERHLRFVLVLVFYSSMIMPNYWPWYNFMAVFYQLASIYFLFRLVFNEGNRKDWINVALCAAFSGLSLFTKQDIGFFATAINGMIILIYAIYRQNWGSLIVFTVVVIAMAMINILPFVKYEFVYWFNYGQFPHHSRVTIKALIQEFIEHLHWIKFYLLVIFIVLVSKNFFKQTIKDNLENVLLAAFTIFILGEAAVIQYTSFNPPDGNIFFHVFALAFILKQVELGLDLKKGWIFIPIVLLTLGWWSFNYWKYANKVLDKVLPETKKSGEYVMTKYTWQVNTDSIKALPYELYPSDIGVLKGISIPKETNEGIHKIMNLDIVLSAGSDLKVLNMSELTFLPFELGYQTIKGANIPLWHHYGVSFFDREIELYCRKVEALDFDLVIFQDVNYSKNYFPSWVNECIEKNYIKQFTFRGPKGFSGEYVHVYTRPEPSTDSEPDFLSN